MGSRLKATVLVVILVTGLILHLAELESLVADPEPPSTVAFEENTPPDQPRMLLVQATLPQVAAQPPILVEPALPTTWEPPIERTPAPQPQIQVSIRGLRAPPSPAA